MSADKTDRKIYDFDPIKKKGDIINIETPLVDPRPYSNFGNKKAV